jgi:hypothetical protein
MDDVAVWRADMDVGVADMGNADFENRTESVSVWDTDGTYRACSQSLADHWGTTVPKAIDRALRLYLAKLIDDGEFDVTREYYEVVTLIPPHGWVDEHIDPPLVTDVPEIKDGDGSVVPSVPPTVSEMIDTAVERGVFESRTEFARTTLGWLVDDSCL